MEMWETVLIKLIKLKKHHRNIATKQHVEMIQNYQPQLISQYKK